MKKYETRPSMQPDGTNTELSARRKEALADELRDKPNAEIRIAMIEKGISQWELAGILGIGETTLCRRLRTELPKDQKAQILKAIKEGR